jgi:hypothetical protein
VTRSLPPRLVSLAVCDAAGRLVGGLPPFEVAFPYWQEVAEVVRAAAVRFGIGVTVLRLLEATPIPGEPAASGPVTYLAQLDQLDLGPGQAAAGNLPLAPLPPQTRARAEADHPLRLGYARPGGPQADLAWADAVLVAAGTPRTGPAVQQRSWNLSSIWRLPTEAGPVWLKVVPPFFAHEGVMIGKVRASGHADAVAEPLAVDGPRVLLRDVPGSDQYGARGPILQTMVRTLVAIQADWAGPPGLAGRTPPGLAGLGVPDWRGETFLAQSRDVVDRTAGELAPAVRTAVERLVAELPERFAALAACGVPDTLVHGDFHPGNVRAASGSGDGDARCVLLDWGDCGIGNPLFDQSAFVDGLPPDEAATVRSTWSRAWREAVPGCDPERAARLIEPISALRRATVYRMFLDGIEPTERVYHAVDPRDWLTAAAAASGSAGPRGPARP